MSKAGNETGDDKSNADSETQAPPPPPATHILNAQITGDTPPPTSGHRSATPLETEMAKSEPKIEQEITSPSISTTETTAITPKTAPSPADEGTPPADQQLENVTTADTDNALQKEKQQEENLMGSPVASDGSIPWPEDGTDIVFRRVDRRAHSYFYVTLTLMIMMGMSVFANKPSSTYLLLFAGWFIMIYFVMDAIEMETAQLRINRKCVRLRRWKNAMTIPMNRIIDLNIWPPNSRHKTGLDIYYRERGKELRQRIRIEDFKNFEDIMELIQQGQKLKAPFELNSKDLKANALFRAKNFDKLIIGACGAIVLGSLHVSLLFDFTDFIRTVF